MSGKREVVTGPGHWALPLRVARERATLGSPCTQGLTSHSLVPPVLSSLSVVAYLNNFLRSAVAWLEGYNDFR